MLRCIGEDKFGQQRCIQFSIVPDFKQWFVVPVTSVIESSRSDGCFVAFRFTAVRGLSHLTDS